MNILLHEKQIKPSPRHKTTRMTAVVVNLQRDPNILDNQKRDFSFFNSETPLDTVVA